MQPKALATALVVSLTNHHPLFLIISAFQGYCIEPIYSTNVFSGIMLRCELGPSAPI